MRDWAPRLLVFIGCVTAVLACAWPLPLHLGTHLTGEPGGDTGVYVWNQWVFHEELAGGHNPLSTDRILGLTSRVDLSQHNYTAFLDAVAAPLLTRLGVITTFNLVFLLMGVLNALATYGLARRAMGAGRFEAWLAGVAFACSPVLVARGTGHFSLVAAAPLPVFLWCRIRAEESLSYRHAALAGFAAAWAFFCDAYYGIYCVLIAGLYGAALVVRVSRSGQPAPPLARGLLDGAIAVAVAVIAGVAITGGGAFSVLGLRVSMRELYTPVLVLTVLVTARALVTWRPSVRMHLPAPGRWTVTAALVAVLAMAGPLSPVLYGVGQRLREGRWVSPQIYWRSSPRGVDLLGLVAPNPNHPLVRWWYDDWQLRAPTEFVEYAASLSLVSLAVVVFAVWRAGFRPRAGWWVVTAGFAALSLGPFVWIAGINTHVPGPWALLRYAPIVGLARMPPRFAIVAALGLAVLLAGALTAIGRQWPRRRRVVLAAVAALLAFELWPAPRPLYSAEISAVYDTIAADPRPVRVLVLPFGVRDGVSSAGNFRARTQFNQTRHGKALVGGYLSRISPTRVERMQQDYPTLAVLLKLSERRPLDEADTAVLSMRGRQFVERARVGYVVVDRRFVDEAAVQEVVRALGLTERQRDSTLTLYAAGL